MWRVAVGGLLALWGGIATGYGLTLPVDRSLDGAGQLAGVIVAACLGAGGLAFALTGSAGVSAPSAGRTARAGERARGRDWESDWEGELARRRRSGPEITPMTFARVFAVVLVLAAVALCTVLITRKGQKPDAEQAGANPPAEGDRLPKPVPELPRPPVPDVRPPVWTPAPVVPVVPPAPPAPRPGLGETNPIGGAFARNDYREYRADGAILTGFEVGYGKVFNTVIIAYLRPIWLTAAGEQYGIAYGRSQTPTVVVKARDGYAVSGMVIAGGGALEGFAITFMKRGAKHLDPTDAYVSDWYGEPTRKPRPEEMRPAGDGAFVIGIFGKRFDDKRGNNYDDGGAIGTIGLVLWAKE